MSGSGVESAVLLHAARILAVRAVMVVSAAELAIRLLSVGNERVTLIVTDAFSEGDFAPIVGCADSPWCPAALGLGATEAIVIPLAPTILGVFTVSTVTVRVTMPALRGHVPHLPMCVQDDLL